MNTTRTHSCDAATQSLIDGFQCFVRDYVPRPSKKEPEEYRAGKDLARWLLRRCPQTVRDDIVANSNYCLEKFADDHDLDPDEFRDHLAGELCTPTDWTGVIERAYKRYKRARFRYEGHPALGRKSRETATFLSWLSMEVSHGEFFISCAKLRRVLGADLGWKTDMDAWRVLDTLMKAGLLTCVAKGGVGKGQKASRYKLNLDELTKRRMPDQDLGADDL